MKKRIGRRLVSLLLTFVTVLTMLPAMTLPARALTKGTLNLTDSSIGLSYTGDAEDPWSVNGEGLFGQVTSDKGTIRWYRYESTLTITNKKTTSATLSFTYTFVLNKGTIEVDGKAPNGTFSKKLEPNEKIKIHIKSGRDYGRTEITITNVNLISEANPAVTFQPAENGSYTVDGRTINEVYTHNQSSMTAYNVEATPANGYQFLGWYDVSNEKYISTDDKTALNFDSDRTITARFASKTAALFETGGQPFDDLGDAVTYAQANSQNKITLASDGKITGTYTIPSGVTLLIPFDAARTLYTSEPGYVNTAETQKAYKTLTMASGSSITVDGGAISVGGKHFAGSSDSCCKATGPYGQIIMQEGSSITLSNGAKLYAWGYITGDGEITAARGATVYEYFQVTDWRGGNATLNMILPPNKQQVFPFSQYYVQNIEAPLTIQNGATEKAYFSVKAKLVGTKSVTIDFIGSNESLFRIYDGGALTKKYDPKTDRITYTTTGSASLDSLALSVAGYDIDSKKYVLPVNSNMTLEILSGNVAVNCDAALLPGARITIARGAELSVSTNKSLYVYDKEQWKGPYVYGSKESGFVPIPYSPSKPGTRTLADAKIDVNGTLTAIGSVYTTESGADICSSEGSGKFVQKNKPGTETKTYQATQEGNNITGYPEIPITAAQLKNVSADKPYTETADSSADTTFTYCNCPTCGGKWVKNLMVAEFNSTQYGTLKEAADAAKGESYVRLLHSTTEDITAQNDLYLDLNGYTVTGDFDMGGHTLHGMDSSSKEYTAPSGKIVGRVSNYAKTYETPKVMEGDVETYDRYVAILGAENTLSFHRFNISVTGYRFELTSGDTPKCALFFIGKFRGDAAAKDRLKKLSFTLKGDNDAAPKEGSCEMPKALTDKFVEEDGDAYLFEFYLMRSFGKDASPASFTEGISATAKATFQNQSDLGEQVSKERSLSFKEAWEKADNLTPAQREIINKILREHGIN